MTQDHVLPSGLSLTTAWPMVAFEDTLQQYGAPLAIILDDHLQPFFQQRIQPTLEKLQRSYVLQTVTASENQKSMETVLMLSHGFLAKGLRRDAIVLGIGGGITCDLAGTVAALYCRGVPLWLVPTTLLAMVDAAVGGKNGVNTPYGKNTLGTIKSPDKVWAHTACLQTLAPIEWLNGLTECLKHGLLASKPHFDRTWKLFPSFQGDLLSLIQESLLIKAAYIQSDMEDYGKRQALNLGHTVGHALELYTNYTYTHGEAVLLGLTLEAQIAADAGILPVATNKEIQKKLLALPNRLLAELPSLDSIQLWQHMQGDKKRQNGQVMMSLLKDIGELYQPRNQVVHPISQEQWENALHTLRVSMPFPQGTMLPNSI